MDEAAASFQDAKHAHEEDMAEMTQTLDAADSKKKMGAKMVYDSTNTISTYEKEESRNRGRKLVAADLSKSMEDCFVFGLASMELAEIKQKLKWSVLSDLDEVPENDWVELRDAFVDCGLDEHPYVVENKIPLTKTRTSNENAKTMVALALGIETSPPPVEEENKRLASELAAGDDSEDDDDSVGPPMKKRKTAHASDADNATAAAEE